MPIVGKENWATEHLLVSVKQLDFIIKEAEKRKLRRSELVEEMIELYKKDTRKVINELSEQL